MIPKLYESGGGTTVHFYYGSVLPYTKGFLRKQTKTRAADGRWKVFDHAWAGSYKRTWKLKAFMDNELNARFGASGYDFDDFIAFLHTDAEFALNKLTFTDAYNNAFTVRIIAMTEPKVVDLDYYEINLLLEEDYA